MIVIDYKATEEFLMGRNILEEFKELLSVEILNIVILTQNPNYTCITTLFGVLLKHSYLIHFQG